MLCSNQQRISIMSHSLEGRSNSFMKNSFDKIPGFLREVEASFRLSETSRHMVENAQTGSRGCQPRSGYKPSSCQKKHSAIFSRIINIIRLHRGSCQHFRFPNHSTLAPADFKYVDHPHGGRNVLSSRFLSRSLGRPCRSRA